MIARAHYHPRSQLYEQTTIDGTARFKLCSNSGKHDPMGCMIQPAYEDPEGKVAIPL